MNDICNICLCKGRNLLELKDKKYIMTVYMQILSEIPVYDASKFTIRVCWECTALLRRFYYFKLQVKNSYIEMTRFLQQNNPESKVFPFRIPCLQIHNITRLSCPELQALQVKNEPHLQESIDIVTVKEEPEEHLEAEAFVNNLPIDISIPIDMPIPLDRFKSKHINKLTRNKVKKKNNVHKKKKKPPPPENLIPVSENNNSDCDDLTIDMDVGDMDLCNEKETDSAAELESKKHKLRIDKVPEKVSVQVSPAKSTPEAKERIQCIECEKTFSSKKTYRYHLNVLHKGQNRYPCPECGKVYQWKSNLGRHMRTHKARAAGELYCSTCDKAFASVATYRQHFKVSRIHVQESDFSFVCNDCGKKFISKTRLRDHIDWEHLKKIKFTCRECNKPFKCHTSLYVHLQNVHRSKDQKGNLCHVCGKSYQSSAKLRYHVVAMHTHETPYRCEQCHAAFGWYSSLYRHVRSVHYKMKVQTKKSKKLKKLPNEILPSLVPHTLALPTMHSTEKPRY